MAEAAVVVVAGVVVVVGATVVVVATVVVGGTVVAAVESTATLVGGATVFSVVLEESHAAMARTMSRNASVFMDRAYGSRSIPA